MRDRLLVGATPYALRIRLPEQIAAILPFTAGPNT